MQNVLEQGPDFWCWFDKTQFSYHCVYPIHANVFSIQMLLHFSQIVPRVCTLVLFITKVTVEHAKVDNEPVINSDDDFMVTNKANKHTHTCTSNESDSKDELVKSEEVRSPLILGMLPARWLQI